MWILTYEVNDYNRHGEYHQYSSFTKPSVEYLASYLKYVNLVTGEPWDIRSIAERLVERQAVEIGWKVFSLWEQGQIGQIPMY